jgi:HK97 family phage prohead protease
MDKLKHQLEQKQLNFGLEVKMLAEDGKFAGYASVFDVVDNQKDVILRGAFRETLQGRKQSIRLLWQHQFEEPIGLITEIFEDDRGLYVEGKLLLDVARAKEAYSLLKANAIGGLSIGYSPVRYSMDPDSGIRRISKVALWEVSLVTFPANEQANITVVKQAKPQEEQALLTLKRNGDYFRFVEALERMEHIIKT